MWQGLEHHSTNVPAELKYNPTGGADYIWYRGQVMDLLKKRQPNEYEKESFKKAFN